jgi:hypothetical protein
MGLGVSGQEVAELKLEFHAALTGIARQQFLIDGNWLPLRQLIVMRPPAVAR